MTAKRAAPADDWGVLVNEVGIFASTIAADRWIAAASTVYVFVQNPGVRGTRATYPEDLTLTTEAGHG
jgi:hypothetical protein